MSIIELVLAALKFINWVMGFIDREQLKQSGRDEVIAQTTAAILKKTETGKAFMEKVNAMSDAQVDDALRGLEPR